MKAKFAATIKNGELAIISGHALRQHLAGYQEGESLEVTVSRRRKTRSTNQNAYYFGVVLKVIADHTGHSVEELHEIFKRKFLPPRVLTYRDQQIRLPASTTDTNTLEFTEYIESIRAEAASMGIEVPNPDQVQF